MDGLRAVVAVAAEDRVDAVLVAGDLFDSGRVPDAVLEAAVDLLAEIDRPVVVIPGNHDALDEYSPYRRVDLGRAGAHVHFVGDPAGAAVVFDELALHVWARGIEHHVPAHRPLAGHRAAPPGYWSVVVTHGHYVGPDERSDRSSPIHAHEIADLECDYLALGHWHRFCDVSAGPVTAFYSGSPWLPWGDGAGVNLVHLDPDRGVTVARRPVPLASGAPAG
jgi:DNA repair exonuclease SbcCD nuclease subunit